MTKPASTNKKPRKQHTPEFRNEALKLAKRIGVAARELSLYESQLYAWRSKINHARSSSEREQEMSVEISLTNCLSTTSKPLPPACDVRDFVQRLPGSSARSATEK